MKSDFSKDIAERVKRSRQALESDIEAIRARREAAERAEAKIRFAVCAAIILAVLILHSIAYEPTPEPGTVNGHALQQEAKRRAER